LIDEYTSALCVMPSQSSAESFARRLHIFIPSVLRLNAHLPLSLPRGFPDGDDETAREVLRDLHAVLYNRTIECFGIHASFQDFILINYGQTSA